MREMGKERNKKSKVQYVGHHLVLDHEYLPVTNLTNTILKYIVCLQVKCVYPRKDLKT